MIPANTSPATKAPLAEISRRLPVRIVSGVRPFFAWLMDTSNPINHPANTYKSNETFSASLWGDALYRDHD